MSSSSRPSPHSPEGARQIWIARTELVKQETAAANAALDANTARLRALRLEKKAREADIAGLVAENGPPAPVKKRAKSGA